MSKWFSDNKLDIVKRFVNVLRASLCSMSFICLFAYLLLTFIEHVYKDDTPQDETAKDSKNYLMLNIQTIFKNKILLPNCVCSQTIMVIKIIVVVVKSFSHVQLFVTPWTATRQASLSFTSPKACSDSCPWSQWCHPTISSSVVPFSSCLQPFPALGSFPVSQLFASGGQSIGASTSVLPMNIQGRFPLGWTGLISLQSKDSQESSPTPQFESINFLALSLLYGPPFTSIHDHLKNHSFNYLDLCQQKKSLLFNILSRFVIAFLPRSKCILISWLQSPSAAMLEPKKLKSVTVSIVFIITNLLHEKRS